MGHYVDLHSHYLPALDDGATDLEMSFEMIKAVVALGFTELFATPHQRAGMFMPTHAAIAETFRTIVAQGASAAAGARLALGAENFWDDVFHQRMQQKTVPSYNAGPAFLFEVSTQFMPPGIENQLFDFRVSGLLPVMAHPERYVAIQREIDVAEKLGRSAALLVDLGALDGAHGKQEMKTARRLVLEGLAHAAASDVHRPEDETSVAAGMAWIVKQRGQAVLDQLLEENPRRILNGDLPEPPRS
ncbi:MAG TPA: CpsB/CapC family capsule biosynthesis tyrosine phosphatase [Polyangia bacterium]|jgi:protein-tyrosine phosphatase|nr:CpsB/CapC family capsule biosynthesis tyrosine phosphatase [Polyangia bacterium]